MLFLLFIYSVISQCTFTQNEWIKVSGGLDSGETMCGIGWHELMKIDASRMIIPENSLWVIVLHQYVSSILNRREILSDRVNASMTINFNNTGIEEAIITIGDSLERSCDNVSQFELLPSIQSAHSLLYDFNHGLIPGMNVSIACQEEYSMIHKDETFYYFNTPDIITVRNPVTNMTMLESLNRGIYNTQIVLYIIIGLICLALGFDLLKLGMMRSEKRRYIWSKKKEDSDKEIEMHKLEEFEISEDDSEIVPEEI